MKKIILIDGNALLFKAYFATAFGGQNMKTTTGIPTNALFAFINMMEKLVRDNEYEKILVAFDSGKPTFRHVAHEAYKQTRKPLEPDLKAQFPLVRKFLQLYGITIYELDGYEADDLIGTYARIANEKGYEVNIISSDKDLLQLINPNTYVTLSKRGLSELEVMDEKALYEKWQIVPDQVRDLKGLMGDPGDNIPGVKGIGEKTALKLLAEHTTLENLYDHLDTVKGKLLEKLVNDRDMAFFSKELATIDCNVPVSIEFEQLVHQPQDTYELLAFYKQYELNAFVKKMQMIHQEPAVEFKYTLLKDNFEAVLKSDMAVVLETFYHKDYHHGVLLGMGVSDGVSHYFISQQDMKDNAYVLEWLKSDNNKLGYDIKKDIVVANWHGIEIKGFTFDLMLATYLLNPMIKNEFRQVVAYYDYEDCPYEEEVYGKGAKKAICEASIYQTYVVKKAKAICALKEEIIDKLTQQQQYSLLVDVEVPISQILAYMEYNGFSIDKDVLAQQEKTLKAQILELEQSIYELSGHTFNINSPKQLGEILFEKMDLPFKKKTKTGYSTSVDVLEQLTLHHPVAQKLIDYRQLTKLYNTYIEGLGNQIAVDGKIHTLFNQATTQTGRLSSSEPNLQNIPVRLEQGKLIRKCFVPSDGYDYIAAFDYSQVELRVLAHVANEQSMIEAFNHHVDIHTNTACALFGVDPLHVDANMRRKAKAVNFGIVYGISDFGLSNQTQTSVVEAKHFIETYFATYPNIEKYMSSTIEHATQHGYITTLLERRRYIPELISNNFMQAQLGRRLAMNSPIQGGAADIIKLAMIKVDAALKQSNIDARMILQVHDELVFEVKKADIDLLCELVVKEMVNAIELKVDLEVDASYGSNWFEVK